MDFAQFNNEIGHPDLAARARAHAQWNQVAKPIGSLGAFEVMVERIAALTGSEQIHIDKRCAVVMCADNGVVSEGVSQSEQDITTLIAGSIAQGTSSLCAMARTAHIDTFAVDIGMTTPSSVAGVIDKCVARGSANICEGSALSHDQVLRAIKVGIECAERAAENGYRLIAVGEMGIGNTTTASALACALLDIPVDEAVGKGAGLSSLGLARKKEAVARALAVNQPASGSYTDDVLFTLRALGGFDIAGMVGLFLGAARVQMPALVDGYISSIAALVAVRLCPNCAFALLPSHVSAEPAAALVADALAREVGIAPVLHAGLHLGEATGAICMVPLLDMALALYNGTTFAETGMDNYEVDPS